MCAIKFVKNTKNIIFIQKLLLAAQKTKIVFIFASMKLSRILLTLSGLAGIIAFFLPWMRSPLAGQKLYLSGLTYFYALLDKIGISQHGGASKFFDTFWGQLTGAESAYSMVQALCVWFIILGPIMFLVFHISHFKKGLQGGFYKRGRDFAWVYMLLSIFFLWYGTQGMIIIHQKFSFFRLVSYGFWVSFAAMIGAWASNILLHRGK